MNKKILLVFLTVFLLACNFLFPTQTPRPTPEPATARPTKPALEPLYATPIESEPELTPEVSSTGMTTVRLHTKDGDIQTLLEQEAQKATELGQMPVVEFDATWCPPCQVIDEGLKSKNELLLDAYAGTYIIKLNVDEWGWGDSTLHDFDFDGIPVYFKLDEQGQPTGEVIDGGAWGDNIPENIAPPMDEFFHGE